jgi:hypothetical protein
MRRACHRLLDREGTREITVLRKLLATIFKSEAPKTPARPVDAVIVNTRWVMPAALVVARSAVKPDGRSRSCTNQLSS